jgi:hypothetical protein
MRLVSYRVTDFRSVKDSGWIAADNVSAHIGINESGKTNLLLPLWKLKPAKGGEINPIADYPRARYNEIRSLPDKAKPIFIRARFELDSEAAKEVAKLAGVDPKDVAIVEVSRRYDGTHAVSFPEASLPSSIDKATVLQLIEAAKSEIVELREANKTEETFKVALVAAMSSAITAVSASDEQIQRDALVGLIEDLKGTDLSKAAAKSVLKPRFERLVAELEAECKAISRPHPDASKTARERALSELPFFVYYSNYGNLDSEIYLPHVIENMKRTDLAGKEEAKARTLKVLFQFVKLKPEEILALGQKHVSVPNPNKDQVEQSAIATKEREILLQSASTTLTRKFGEWWKQGDYNFRFQADGNHFRIWVSDKLRPEPIELENRSTGLQWFLSFYLIFLVESEDTHENAILLLDEPGMTLHPLAQKDLSDFFEGLSASNQILYTTHSPFMIDADRLDRVKAVYIDEQGMTAVSADLRAPKPKSIEEKSIYSVHAAMGLSVSDALLQGCQTVLVEGASDLHYLSAIRNVLIGAGAIKPCRDLVFLPSGGTKGIKAVIPIISAKNDQLPFVVLDGDENGRVLATSLRKDLFAGDQEAIIGVDEFTGMASSEVEDLIPQQVLIAVLSRMFRSAEDDFDSGKVDAFRPILPQAEAFAKAHAVELEKGWKVEVAKNVKLRMLKDPKTLLDDAGKFSACKKLFERLVLRAK